MSGIGATARSLRALVAEMARTSPRQAAAAVALLFVLTVTEGAGLLLLAPLLELVGVVEDNPLPRAAGWLESLLGSVGLQPTLGAVLAVFVGIAVTRALAARAQAHVNAEVREHITLGFERRLYAAMNAAEWRFLVTKSSPLFVHALTTEVGRIGGAANQLTLMAVEAVVALLYVALALRLSAAVALVALASAGVLAWWLRGSIARARAAGIGAAEGRARLHAAISEQVAGLKAARSVGATARHADAFDRLARDARLAGLETAAVEADVQQRLEFGSNAALAGIVFVASELEGVSPAVLLILLFAFARLMPRLVALSRRAQVLAAALPSLDHVTRLERECAAAAEPRQDPACDLPPLATDVRFENVSFAYAGRETTPAVDGLDLAISAGFTTAVVGPSGSGKSTVADLLMGLLVPSSGRMLVDGTPLSPGSRSAWRRQIGYVPQDAFLLDDTVRANLRWVRPDAADEELRESLRLAAADSFVDALPQGIDTVVGERGVRLSGGERQRLAIARALVGRPRLLVLDEATSAVDADNERRIQQAIDLLHHRLTIVVIAHRPSSIRGADIVHEMAGGRIVRSTPAAAARSAEQRRAAGSVP